MSTTKIEWAHETINPVIGCSHSGSPGCNNCYAEKFAARMAPNPKAPREYQNVVANGKWNGQTAFVKSALEKMLRIPGKGKRVFVGSMTDTFHDDVPFGWIDRIMVAVALQPLHTFLLLTKRPARMREYFSRGLDLGLLAAANYDNPLSNLWLGVSVCNQEEADAKIPLLLKIPASKYFVSIEPMLGPISLFTYLFGSMRGGIELPDKLNWVIVGGETGPGARPMHPSWVRSIRDQCQASGVPFFFKSWGKWCPRSNHPIINGLSASQLDMDCTKWECVRLTAQGKNGWSLENVNGGEDVYMQRVGKQLAGHLLDGREWREVPE